MNFDDDTLAKLKRIGALEALIDLIIGQEQADFVSIATDYMLGQIEHTEVTADPVAHVNDTLAECERNLAEAIEDIIKGIEQ